MNRFLGTMAVLGGLCFSSGCGGTGETPVVVEEVIVPAKAMLEGVAESGELGSASMEIRDSLEGMKVSGDAAKADELLKDLDELEGLSDEAQIKRKASAMAAKL